MAQEKNEFLKNPEKVVSDILINNPLEKSRAMLDRLLSCIDLTTLNTQDTSEKVRSLCLKINELPVRFPGTQNVGVCEAAISGGRTLFYGPPHAPASR